MQVRSILGLACATASSCILAIGVLLVPSAASAQTAAHSADPAFCGATGPIPVTEILSPVNLSTCPIQGRLIVQRLARGGLGAGAHVPPAGMAVGNDTLTTNGEYELKVVNSNGRVTVSWSYSTRTSSSASVTGSAAASTDPACSEPWYNYEGYFWFFSDHWYINKSTISNRTNLYVPAAVTNIRDGGNNMAVGKNNCGWSTSVFNAYHSYQGDTSRYANINKYGNCTSKFPDGQNTDSFGPFAGSALSNGYLAVTCYTGYVIAGEMTEADTYFGSNVGIVNSLPSNCSNSYDLQSIATHEWGHAFGMAHETNGHSEVMYPYISACHKRRHLGEGDYNGMAGLYFGGR